MLREFSKLARVGAFATLPPPLKLYLDQPQELLSAHLRVLMSPQDLSVVLSAFARALHDGFMAGLAMTVIGLFISFLLPSSTLHTLQKSR
jgi:hypothetical protein